MLSIRYDLQKQADKLCSIDVVNGKDVNIYNKIFLAMFVKLKQEGKARVQHKEPHSKHDLQTLYSSFDLTTTFGLQNKVFVDIMLFFYNTGRREFEGNQENRLHV